MLAAPLQDPVSAQGAKPHSTPLTLKWLEDNYEMAEGVCIPRSTLYLHYRNFCRLNNTCPVNAASFGKIIRQQFPQITTRRLGTRGQSKCHTEHGVSRERRTVSGTQVVSAPSRPVVDMALPQLPSVDTIRLPADIDTDMVSNFLGMYKCHCQRILDCVTAVNFDQLQNCEFCFWQGMPTDIIPLLHKSIIVKLVGVCDCILYKTLAGVLIPTVLHTLPDSLCHMTLKFAQELESYLTRALWGLPDSLQRIKLEMARRFSQTLRRQISLSQLVQTTRSVVTSPNMVSQLLSDWMNVDHSSIAKQTLYATDQFSDRQHTMILDFCADFERLLEEQAQMEEYLCWLDNLVQCCVLKVSQKRRESPRSMARQFLLVWSCFATRVARDMTLQSAPSFGSFHLLHLMFDDYVFHLIDCLRGDLQLQEFMAVLKGETVQEDQAWDVTLTHAGHVNDVVVSARRSGPGRQCRKMTDTSAVHTETTEAEGSDDDIGDDSSDGDEEEGDMSDQVSAGVSGDILSSGVSGDILSSGVPSDMVSSGVPGDMVSSGVPGDIVSSSVPGDIVSSGVICGTMPADVTARCVATSAERSSYSSRQNTLSYNRPQQQQPPHQLYTQDSYSTDNVFAMFGTCDVTHPHGTSDVTHPHGTSDVTHPHGTSDVRHPHGTSDVRHPHGTSLLQWFPSRIIPPGDNLPEHLFQLRRG